MSIPNISLIADANPIVINYVAVLRAFMRRHGLKELMVGRNLSSNALFIRKTNDGKPVDLKSYKPMERSFRLALDNTIRSYDLEYVYEAEKEDNIVPSIYPLYGLTHKLYEFIGNVITNDERYLKKFNNWPLTFDCAIKCTVSTETTEISVSIDDVKLEFNIDISDDPILSSPSYGQFSGPTLIRILPDLVAMVSCDGTIEHLVAHRNDFMQWFTPDGMVTEQVKDSYDQLPLVLSTKYLPSYHHSLVPSMSNEVLQQAVDADGNSAFMVYLIQNQLANAISLGANAVARRNNKGHGPIECLIAGINTRSANGFDFNFEKNGHLVYQVIKHTLSQGMEWAADVNTFKNTPEEFRFLINHVLRIQQGVIASIAADQIDEPLVVKPKIRI
ncbi:hypothetical protein ACKF11_13330 [Methylobacillus sp. Pita2]|uniref:hypothetical protein n=1 Tax=Methylobacillus sp. Pita2 TaxID=3383245 RepID=UPI0038B4D444